jgi:hypothetical protein
MSAVVGWKTPRIASDSGLFTVRAVARPKAMGSAAQQSGVRASPVEVRLGSGVGPSFVLRPHSPRVSLRIVLLPSAFMRGGEDGSSWVVRPHRTTSDATRPLLKDNAGRSSRLVRSDGCAAFRRLGKGRRHRVESVCAQRSGNGGRLASRIDGSEGQRWKIRMHGVRVWRFRKHRNLATRR